MSKATFPDTLNREDLEFRSTKTETREYNRKLSEEEIAQLAEDMLANHDNIADLQEQLREHSKAVREEVKQVKERNKLMRSERKSGMRSEFGPVRLVMDYEGRRVGEYTQNGILIRVRSMRDAESQLRIDEETGRIEGVINHPAAAANEG